MGNHKNENFHNNSHLEADNLNSFSIFEKLTFENPITQGEIKKWVLKLVRETGNECIEQGAPVLGHIKGRLEMEDIIRFSLVQPEVGVQTDGDIDEALGVKRASIKILGVVPLKEQILDNIGEKIRKKFLERR